MHRKATSLVFAIDSTLQTIIFIANKLSRFVIYVANHVMIGKYEGVGANSVLIQPIWV